MSKPSIPEKKASEPIMATPPEPKETLSVPGIMKNSLSLALSPFKAGLSVLSLILAAAVYAIGKGIKKLTGIEGDLSESIAGSFFSASKNLFKSLFSPFLYGPKMLHNQVDNKLKEHSYHNGPIATDYDSLNNLTDAEVVDHTNPGPSPDFHPIDRSTVGAKTEKVR